MWDKASVRRLPEEVEVRVTGGKALHSTRESWLPAGGGESEASAVVTVKKVLTVSTPVRNSNTVRLWQSETPKEKVVLNSFRDI